MARTGKIARLDVDTRYSLNCRLRDGEPAKEILVWLNAQEETISTMKCYFKEAPVTESNLTEWRQGGYQDWLRHEETLSIINDLEEESWGFKAAGEDQNVSELLAARITAELAQIAKALLAETTDPRERWKILKEILPHLDRIRRADRSV